MLTSSKNKLLYGIKVLFNFFFFVILLIIKFFILVGEITTYIFLSPFRLIKYLFSYLKKSLPKPTSKKPKKRAGKKSPTVVEKIVFPIIGDDFLPVTAVQSAFAFLSRRITRASKPLFRKFPTLRNLKQSLFFSLSKIVLALEVVWHSLNKKIKRLFIVIKNIILVPFLIIKFLISPKFRYFYVGFSVCLLAIFFYQSYAFMQNLPSPANIGKTNYQLSTHLYDRNGKLLYEIYRDQNRTPVKLADLPPYVAQASIAIEDKDFYHHGGISFVGGILRALRDTWKTNELQGGSTITQQLIKSALLTPERTLERKIKEAILAIWAERIYTKKQILEMYLNQVPYGGSAYGVEEAAKTYFDKDATKLTIAEAAMLAGLTQAPSLYSPYINPKLARERRNDVLKNMYQQKYITKKQYTAAVDEKLDITSPKTKIRAPHFVFYTKAALEDEYGIAQVEEGGLRAVTTLDLTIQEEAEKILQEELAKVAYLNITNAGILVTKPATGEILAMVGSADYFALPSGAFNVTTALRQPGSSMKPILYSLALENGYTAASVIDDSPIVYNFGGYETYRPVNYDGKFHGKVSLRLALANSFNIPAVKVLNSLGVANYVAHARNLGITTWSDPSRYGLSLALGGGEVRMVDEATAFGVLANGGKRVDLTPIKTLTDKDNNLLKSLDPQPTSVLPPGVAFIITDILADNNARQIEFGVHSALEIPGYKVAVKTGTTDSKRDNWTVGYTPDYLVVVWVGNNDNSPMNQYLASGITGAAPIWNRMMTYLLTHSTSNTSFIKPADIVQKLCFGHYEYFLTGTESSANCVPTIIKSNSPEVTLTPGWQPTTEIQIITPPQEKEKKPPRIFRKDR